MGKRNQTETITLRLTPEEKYKMLQKMYESAAPSMRFFILSMCFNGKIEVNTELEELNKELRYQGNNLNQLLKLAYQNKISVINLKELMNLYEKILDALGGNKYGGG